MVSKQTPKESVQSTCTHEPELHTQSVPMEIPEEDLAEAGPSGITQKFSPHAVQEVRICFHSFIMKTL